MFQVLSIISTSLGYIVTVTAVRQLLTVIKMIFIMIIMLLSRLQAYELNCRHWNFAGFELAQMFWL